MQRLWGHSADAQFAQKVYLETFGLEPLQIAFLLCILVALMGIVYTFNRVLKLQLNWHIKLLLVPICLFAVWLLAPEGSLPYIYFDF
jgi:alginate O-acetyltransferase complex protein AlgI